MNRIFDAAIGKQTRSVLAELRTGTDDEFALVGYAATFNSWSKDLGGFREQIKPGTFARSIKNKADVKCLFNHAPDNILGRTKSGTLSLSEDSHGLKFRCRLDRNSQYHKDLYSAVKRGDIDECSFAFTVADGGQSWKDGLDPESNSPIALRTLTNVDLLDCSLVTYPAYNETTAGARNQRSKPDYAVNPADLAFAIKQLRKASQLMARGAYSLEEQYGRLQQANAALQHCEIAYSQMRDLSDWADNCDDCDTDLRAHYRQAVNNLNLACEWMAKGILKQNQAK